MNAGGGGGGGGGAGGARAAGDAGMPNGEASPGGAGDASAGDSGMPDGGVSAGGAGTGGASAGGASAGGASAGGAGTPNGGVSAGGAGAGGTSAGGGVSAGGAGAGGTSAAGAGGSVPVDHVPPTILSITPVNQATKLTPATDIITVTFSEPMNKASAQAAYVPVTTGTTPTFVWNAGGNVLTIDPKVPYPSATDPTAAALPFKFSITTSAKDLAGNPLSVSLSWQFTLFREITQSCSFISSLSGNLGPPTYVRGSFVGAGDTSADVERRGLLSFDISGLPDMIQTVESATITTSVEAVGGDPFGLFGNMLIQSVSFSSVNQTAFDAPLLHDLGIFIAATGTNAAGDAVLKDVLVALKDDYANRVTRGNVSQYKLLFAGAPSVNATTDIAYIMNTAANDAMVVKYLYP